MFGIGLYELVIILVITVIVIRPKDLPKIASKAGRIIQKLKKYFLQLRDDFNDISDAVMDEDNFKTWEDRVDEKRREYDLNVSEVINPQGDKNAKKAGGK